MALGMAALLAAGALMEGGLISTAMEANVAEATVEEGNNEINNGNQGIDEKGYNRIRDGELGGDKEAYQEYQDKAIGLWETGVMINITAATVGTEALPVAGVADMYLSSKLPNLSNMFASEEEEFICSSNPLLEIEGEKNEANLVNEGGSKTGIGTSGEGLLLEDVPYGVLKDVSPDDSAVFGYSPNKGTRYDSPDYDFTNEDFARRNQAIRKDYLNGSETLKRDIEIMRSEGKSSQEIGEYCVNTRNQQKIDSRSHMLPDEVKKIGDENIKRYQDPVGPSPQQQFNSVKKKLIKNGIYESDEQVWETVIEGSMKKDDVINTLLGIKH